MQAEIQHLWCLSFRNSAFPGPIWGRHNKTTEAKRLVFFERWQLRQTFFCNEHTSIRANVVSPKQAACYIVTFSSLLTTAQEILPGAIDKYKLKKAGINFDIVLSSRHVGQRAVSNRCSWKQHRSPQEQHAGEKLRFWAADIHTVHFSIHSRPNTKIHTLLQQLHTHTHASTVIAWKQNTHTKNTQLQPVGQCCWVETSSKEQKKKLTCRHL